MNIIATREELEQEELKRLAPYAIFNAKSKGRDYDENHDLYRLDFQRDRDRVLHCKAFRRLKGKTQVFVSHYGDHFRSRLTHSLEVAQIACAIARGLRVNEDLTECIALAHDLGHTPFGHAGEDAMNELMHRFGLDFEHNAQSRRIVEKLEKKSANFLGLNLTHEVREGLWKHRTPYDKSKHKLSEQPFLEAQIVDLADEIAFQNHDIDDGLRSGLLELDDLNKLSLWRKAQEQVSGNLSEENFISAVVSALIKIMIHDVFQKSSQNIGELSPKSADDVRNASKRIISFSKELAEENSYLRQLLMDRFYHNNLVASQCEKGAHTIKRLFFYYLDNLDQLPEGFEKNEIGIKDFIAGMTDNFAIDKLKEIENK